MTPRQHVQAARWGRWVRDGFTVGIVGIWALLSARLPEYLLPSPWQVFTRTVDLFIDPRWASHTYRSLERVGAALALALLLGTVLAVIARYQPVLQGFIIHRLLPLFNAFPTLGWALLAIYWFGVHDLTVIFVEAAILLPFIMTNLWQGLQQLDAELMEMGRSFSRHRAAVFLHVAWPMLVPHLLAALRVAYGVGWKIALIAEVFGTQRGLGYLLNVARSQFDSALMFATIAAVIVLVFVVERGIFRPLERRWLGSGAGIGAESSL